MFNPEGKLKRTYRLHGCKSSERMKGQTCDHKIAEATRILRQKYPKFDISSDAVFVSLQINGPEMNAYFGRIADLHRTKNHIEIRMNEPHTSRYLCLAERELHNCCLPPNVDRINGELVVCGFRVRSVEAAYADYLQAWRARFEEALQPMA